jgi:hypothetical protein
VQHYNIVVLGPSGSGKTVFLASMFHRLSVQGEDTGFALTTDLQRANRLNDVYNEVIDPGKQWPRSTTRAEISEWPFTCYTIAGGRRFDILTFNYFDYAGELLTDSSGSDGAVAVQNLERTLQKADALLGILDGQRVLALMEGRPEGSRLLTRDMTPTFKIMGEHMVPAHFIISKWDLLQDKGFTLLQVRQRLQQDSRFNNLVATRAGLEKPFRLIPISAVGPGFAQLQGGAMVKRAGVMPRPFHVETPLVCVLPDHLEAQYNELTHAQKTWLEREQDKKKGHQVFGKFLRIFGPAALLAQSFLPGGGRIGLQPEMIEKWSRHLELGSAKDIERQQAGLQVFTQQQEAMEYVTKGFYALSRRLEYDFPASNLLRP